MCPKPILYVPVLGLEQKLITLVSPWAAFSLLVDCLVYTKRTPKTPAVSRLQGWASAPSAPPVRSPGPSKGTGTQQSWVNPCGEGPLQTQPTSVWKRSSPSTASEETTPISISPFSTRESRKTDRTKAIRSKKDCKSLFVKGLPRAALTGVCKLPENAEFIPLQTPAPSKAILQHPHDC